MLLLFRFILLLLGIRFVLLFAIRWGLANAISHLESDDVRGRRFNKVFVWWQLLKH